MLPTIWYSPARESWMEHKDPRLAREKLAKYPDAINITNAYEIYSPEFIRYLCVEAGRT